jgi:hypothetical protein
VTEGAGGDVDARNPFVRDVAAQERSVLVVRLQYRGIDESAQRERGVDPRAGVSLAQDEAIAVLPVGPRRIQTQDPGIEHRQRVRAREHGADVRAAAGVRHAQRMAPDLESHGPRIGHQACTWWKAFTVSIT